MNDSSALDPTALERLRRLGGDKFACEMIDLFLDYVQKKIAEARQAQVAGNLAVVQKAVHPIKSSAGNIGAAQVQALATRIETEARLGQAELVAASLPELASAFAAVRPELEVRKASLANPPMQP